MIGALFRVIAGFILASFAAGLTFVLFAVPPSELASAKSPGLGSVADWALKAGTQAAIFSAPFALIAAAIGEWQRLRSPVYYGMAGLFIAIAGFLAQRSSETSGQETVLNPYAISAFLASGLLAGLVYWLIAGRVAGDEDAEGEARSALAPPADKPVEPKPTAKPAEAKAAEVKAADVKPAHMKVSEPKPTEAKAAEVKAPAAKPPEAKAMQPATTDKAAEVKPTRPADDKGPAVTVEKAKAVMDETRPLVTDPEVKT